MSALSSDLANDMRLIDLKRWPFFLLPFSVLAGTAGQGIGLYLFGILAPLWLYRQRVLIYSARIQVLSLSISLMGLYLLFPVIDGIHSLLAGADDPLAGSMPLWAHGPLSSSFLATGFFLGVLACLNRIKGSELTTPVDGQETSVRVFQHFTKGLVFASTILIIYVLIQTLDGFDYRKIMAYRPERLMVNGWYRPSGFYTHPLSLAGVSLGIASFYWSIFWQSFEKKNPELLLPLQASFFIAVTHYIILFLSASRTASAVGVLMILGIPLFSSSSKQLRQWKVLAMFIVLIPIGFLGSASGLWQRFHEGFSGNLNLTGDHRLDFWRVHWQMFLDQPILGHGYARVVSFERDAYYNALGLGDLVQKYNAHNIFLELLADVGLVGSLLVLGLTSSFFMTLRRACEREAIGGSLMTAFGLSFLANAIHGLTQNTFFDSNVAFVYLAFFLMIFWSLVDHAPYEQL